MLIKVSMPCVLPRPCLIWSVEVVILLHPWQYSYVGQWMITIPLWHRAGGYDCHSAREAHRDKLNSWRLCHKRQICMSWSWAVSSSITMGFFCFVFSLVWTLTSLLNCESLGLLSKVRIKCWARGKHSWNLLAKAPAALQALFPATHSGPRAGPPAPPCTWPFAIINSINTISRC